MDTTTAPQRKRMGRVPKDPNCPKNAAQRAKYHRKMARLLENPNAYQEHLDRMATYQRAYRQTEAGHAVAQAATDRGKRRTPSMPDDDRHDSYITMFAMNWAAVRDRILPYRVELGEEEK